MIYSLAKELDRVEEERAWEKARKGTDVSKLPYDCHARAMKRIIEDHSGWRKPSEIDIRIVFGSRCGKSVIGISWEEASKIWGEENKEFKDMLEKTREHRQREREERYGVGCA